MQELGRIGLSEAQGDLLDVAEDFCREKSPIATVRRLIDDDLGFEPAVWRDVTALGWTGLAIPEAYGGSGLPLGDAVPLAEAMGRYLMASPFVSTTLAAQLLIAAGTEAQCRKWLPRLASGAAATVAVHDTAGSWDLHAPSCRAEADGDRLNLSGTKRLVTDAAVAELMLVTAMTAEGVTILALASDDLPDGALRRETLIDPTRRAYALRLDGLSVAQETQLDLARTPSALAHLHLAANLLLSADCVGANRATIDLTTDYLRTRTQFGRPIGAFQALKHPTVEAYTRFEQARSHLYAAANVFNRQGEGEIATRMAQVSALQSLAFGADRAIQFHGGFGFTFDCDAHLHRRRAIWAASQYGDATYHKRKLADLLLAQV